MHKPENDQLLYRCDFVKASPLFTLKQDASRCIRCLGCHSRGDSPPPPSPPSCCTEREPKPPTAAGIKSVPPPCVCFLVDARFLPNLTPYHTTPTQHPHLTSPSHPPNPLLQALSSSRTVCACYSSRTPRYEPPPPAPPLIPPPLIPPPRIAPFPSPRPPPPPPPKTLPLPNTHPHPQ